MSVVVIALQVAGVVEPVIGIFTDLGCALIKFDAQPLKNIAARLIFIPYNVFRFALTSVLMVPVYILVCRTAGGMLDPTSWKDPALKMAT